MPLCLLLFASTSSVYGNPREWVDSTGKHRVLAELVAIRGDKVILEKQDGSIITIPIARLSSGDQTFLKQAARSKPTPNPSVSPESSLSGSPASSMGTDSVGTPPPPSPRKPTAAERKVGEKAIAILKTHCFRCHGEAGADEGGFDFALSREKLVSAGYVVIDNASESTLYQRMQSTDSPMPPEGESPRPTAEELAVVRDWIQMGAPSPVDEQPSGFITTADVYTLAANDLKSLPKRDRPYARYFSLTHLKNAGASKEELATCRSALAKLINSLSWHRRLAALHKAGSQDGQEFLYRIDLRDLQWETDNWDMVLAHYPHGLVFESRHAFNLRVGTDCEVPIVKADWFVAAASKPPLYHDLAQIPTTDKRLESRLRVNVQENIDQGRTVRVGFARSGVSQNNRLIERHESVFGAYWKSYDFAGNTGRKSLFENPLGPGTTAGTFAHDGGEIIFRLPNGMLGYMLTDEAGRRIDRGPIEIVSDPKQPDRTVVNGVSCMSCHYGGFIQKRDEIRRHVQANQAAYTHLDEILAIYREDAESEKLLHADTQDYLATLSKNEIGIQSPTRAGEPVVLIANRYQNEVDRSLAAAELGMPPGSFDQALGTLVNSDPDLSRTVGALKVRGGVVKRESFDSLFAELASKLGVGDRPSYAVTTSTRSATNAGGTRPAAAGGAGLNSMATKAEDALQAGSRAMTDRKWKEAEDEFDIALRQAPDDNFRMRVYEKLARLHERGESLTPLLNDHKFLLESCKTSDAMREARDNFFVSLVRFANKSNGWASSWSREVDWEQTKLPPSVANPVEELYTKLLRENPQHEAALRVMEFFWFRVREAPVKRMQALIQLREILIARGEKLDQLSAYFLADLAGKHGDPRQGAELVSKLAEEDQGSNRLLIRILEGEAWVRAADNERATKALQIALQLLKKQSVTTRSSSQVERVGDLLADSGNPELAVDAFRMALQREKSAYQVEKFQKEDRCGDGEQRNQA